MTYARVIGKYTICVQIAVETNAENVAVKNTKKLPKKYFANGAMRNMQRLVVLMFAVVVKAI